MKASECKCCNCNKQAVAFWPLLDLDIPSQPYCRECLDKAKMNVLMEIFGYSQKEAETFYQRIREHKKTEKKI